MDKISILEVGPRDGLQNEQTLLSLDDKKELIKKLSLIGLNRIELGSFVSPKWVPQMRDTEQLVQQVLRDQSLGELSQQIQFSALVPNLKGLSRALESGIKEISIFLSATDSFSKKNINHSMEESYKIYKEVCQQAQRNNLKIRAYLSVCFYCPYEGRVKPNQVLEWVKRIEDLGVYEISISDTVGKARALEVQNLLEILFNTISKNKIACHFHDVHGMALANVWSAYKMGIRSFDGSLGGLGGCPYSQAPSGNIPTESLIYLLKDPKDPLIQGLIETGWWLEKKLNKKLPSALLRSPYYGEKNTDNSSIFSSLYKTSI